MPGARRNSKPPATLAQAMRLQRAGKRREAIPILKELAKRHPDDEIVWFRLGTMLDASGKMEQAIPCYLRALRLDPRHPYQYEMCLYLCSSYRKTGRKQIARRWLNRAETFSRNTSLERRLRRLLKPKRA
jgi:tetratricopeptide (TPR) repeat protein